MKNRRTIARLLVVGMLLGFASGKAAQANLILNPGFQFTGGGAYTNNPADMPNWDTSVGAPFFSNPQGIFNYTTEYMQLQTGTTQDLYQHVTVGSSDPATLSIEGMHRNDNVNPGGTVFANLYAGTLTSFGSATPITPNSSVWPSLSNSIQTFSHTYDSLAAGDYTVRMGGTLSSGGMFQAGMDNISLTVGAQPPAAQAGLVGYWNFDADNADDLSGNANHGTLVNSPGFSTDMPSTPGNVKSLDLTGSGDHVRVPHSPSLAIADAITVAYWVKGGDQGAWIRSISKSDGISGWEQYRTGSNQIDVRMDTSGAINQNLGGGASALDDTWHHVAMTADNGLTTVYLDGTPLPGISYSHGAGFANVYDLAIGSTSQTFGYGNYDLNGLVDEVVIYNESLPPNQIAHIARGGDPTNLPVPAAVTSRLGTWSYEGYGGDIGYMSGLFTERATQFGLHLRGESVIDSFTIDQVDAAGRHRIKDITVYASPTESYNFQLTDSQAPQTFSLPGVRTSSLLMTVDSRYETGSNDYNMGISALSLIGSEIAPDVNLNAGILPVTTGGLSGLDLPARATDGTVHDGGTSDWSNDTATFFTRNAGQDSLTVSYAEPTSINTIGLGIDSQRIAGAGADGLRDIPKLVTLEYDGGSQQVDLWGDMFQYARYSLNTPITDTSFLRIVFPDGSSSGDWYVHGDANYGITEFQAFNVAGAAAVPEPSTFALAALGLLGLGWYGRRRRKRA